MGFFFTPLDLILSSGSKLRLLRVLHGTRSPVSGREAAAAAGVAVQPAQRALADLVAVGVVNRHETRSQHLYTLNRENVLVQGALGQLFQAEAARVEEVFRDLARAVGGNTGRAVEGLYLFGSAARGKDRVGSDFDVVAVVSAPSDVDAVHETLAQSADQLYTRYGLRLSVLVLDLGKLREMRGDGDALVAELLRDNRRITGKRLEALLHGHTGKQKGS
ncbi:MAG: nucleotidyltransferase domain-containing protein [Gemmatimonadetes bacterium]|nr:nucleotidyltransferase domain-containing protein [Gemmatimonadota bacterium]